jgi:hypothetical protein
LGCESLNDHEQLLHDPALDLVPETEKIGEETLGGRERF